MQDRPTAAELFEAAADFLENEVMPELTGRKRFHTRVVVNVLAILRRELEQEEDALHSEWFRLARLLGPTRDPPSSLSRTRDAVRELNQELARAIRSGEMDDRWQETLEAVRQTVAEKLRVANPGYAEDPPEGSSDT